MIGSFILVLRHAKLFCAKTEKYSETVLTMSLRYSCTQKPACILAHADLGMQISKLKFTWLNYLDKLRML